MKNILLVLSATVLLSCNFGCINKSDDSLKRWIVDRQKQIDLTTDSIIHDYHERNKTDSNWTSAAIAITKYAPNIVGELATKAGDSTNCIIIELLFYKDPSHKKSILIAARDSSCLMTLNKTLLPLDSVGDFTFGVKRELLQ